MGEVLETNFAAASVKSRMKTRTAKSSEQGCGWKVRFSSMFLRTFCGGPHNRARAPPPNFGIYIIGNFQFYQLLGY